MFEGGADITLGAENSQLSKVQVFGSKVEGSASKFNRMTFNRGEFNTSGRPVNRAAMSLGMTGQMSVAGAVRGCAAIALKPTGRLSAYFSFNGSTGLEVTAAGQVNAGIPLGGKVETALDSTGALNRRRGLDGFLDIVLTVHSDGFNIFRYEHIHMPTLNIPVGGELIIDTDNMTITLNGQNVMRHLSRDSEFFLLNPATNEIVFTSGNQNNRADIRVLHKDAWL